MISLKKFLIFFVSFNLFLSCNFIKSNGPTCYIPTCYVSDYKIFQIIYSNDLVGFNQWIQENPNVNIFNEHRQTPLMIAAQNKNFSFSKQLLKAGANKYCVDIFGKTAKDYALQAEGYDNYSSNNFNEKHSQLNEFGKDIALSVTSVLITEAILYLLCCAFNLEYHNFHHCHHTYMNHNNKNNHCIKCGSCLYFTYDPKELYCSNCYKRYFFLKNYYS